MDSTRAAGKIPRPNDPSVKKGKNYVLAIGIDDYTHCPKLKNAVKDIKDFVTLLTDKFGFHEDSHIKFLCNDEATYEHIFNALEYLIDNVKDVDNVLIYFSGHGDFDQWDGYWIPFEAVQGNRKDYISNNYIQTALRKINSFHTFLIADSCYSGSLFSDSQGRFISTSYDFPSRWGLTSGRNTIVSDGKAGTNSPFAAALLSALRRLDIPMNVSALCDLIKQAVPAATNKLQTPIGDPLSIKGHEGGQFVFYPKSKIQADLEILEKQEESKKEVALWQEAVEKNTSLGYLRYLRQYPNGRFLQEAEDRLDAIENKEEAEKQQREEAERVRKATIVSQETEQKERDLQELERVNDLDDMLEDAACLVVQNQYGSTTMLQRSLKLGYNRAIRIMEQLEHLGIVGSNESPNPHESLFHDEGQLLRFMQELRAKKYS